MKAKILLLFSCLLLSVGVFASERVVWSGNQPISWSPATFAGLNYYKVQNFNDLQPGETIKIYTKRYFSDWNTQYTLVYLPAGSWTSISTDDFDNNPSDGIIRYTPSADKVADIVANGLIVSGIGYDLRQVAIVSANGEKTIANFDTLNISWAKADPGIQFMTNSASVDFSQVSQGSTIKIYTEATSSNPTYALRYIDNTSKWSWIPASHSFANDVMSYKVPTRAISDSIRNRGIVLTGNKYAINRIAVESTRDIILWEGEEVITNWGQYCDMKDYKGFVSEGDSIYVMVSDTDKTVANYPQVHIKWDATTGTNRDKSFSCGATYTYPCEFGMLVADTMITQMAETNKLYINGKGVTVNRVRLRKAANDAQETTVWTAKGKAISWQEAPQPTYAGVQFDTWAESTPNIDLTSVQAGDVFTVHVTAGINNPSYQVNHKRGSEWTWTRIDEDFNTTNAPTTAGAKGYFTYTVSDSTAATIPTRGIVFTGIGYNIDFITRTIPASNLTLNDNVDESAKLSRLQALDGPANITINRTIYKDGYYNTLCLPFDVPTLAGTPLEGATVRAFESAEVIDNVVYVTINDVRSLSAGVPYLVRFEAGEDIDAMTFNDVTVTATTGRVTESTAMNFNGILQPTELDASENLLFLGENNTLYWPEIAANLNGFRAYFSVISALGAPKRGMRACLQEGAKPMPTSIDVITTENNATKCIYNGQLIIIKDGIQYNMLGQRQ